MSKDLTRRTDITKSEQTKTKRSGTKQTEVERAQEALAESMLFGASTRPQQFGPPALSSGSTAPAPWVNSSNLET